MLRLSPCPIWNLELASLLGSVPNGKYKTETARHNSATAHYKNSFPMMPERVCLQSLYRTSTPGIQHASCSFEMPQRAASQNKLNYLKLQPYHFQHNFAFYRIQYLSFASLFPLTLHSHLLSLSRFVGTSLSLK
jgi:hypothetical protein